MFIEEQITVPSGGVRLAAVLGYPESGMPAYAMLLCPPHPNFSGDMENNVITALAREFSRDALTLRFNYRGIGQSEIALPQNVSLYDFWNDVEETKDYSVPLCDVQACAAELARLSNGAPLIIVGYSFGSIVGLMAGQKLDAVALVGIAPPLIRYDFSFLAKNTTPALLISGADDFVFSREASDALVMPQTVHREILSGEDHFFREHEADLASRVRRFIQEFLPADLTGEN